VPGTAGLGQTGRRIRAVPFNTTARMRRACLRGRARRGASGRGAAGAALTSTTDGHLAADLRVRLSAGDVQAGRQAPVGTSHCRSCTATGWWASSMPRRTGRPTCCASTRSTRTSRSARPPPPPYARRSGIWARPESASGIVSPDAPRSTMITCRTEQGLRLSSSDPCRAEKVTGRGRAWRSSHGVALIWWSVGGCRVR